MLQIKYYNIVQKDSKEVVVVSQINNKKTGPWEGGRGKIVHVYVAYGLGMNKVDAQFGLRTVDGWSGLLSYLLFFLK